CAWTLPQSPRRGVARVFVISSWPAPGTISVYRPDRQPFAQSSNLCQKQKHYPSVVSGNSGQAPSECWHFRTSQIPHEWSDAISSGRHPGGALHDRRRWSEHFGTFEQLDHALEQTTGAAAVDPAWVEA